MLAAVTSCAKLTRYRMSRDLVVDRYLLIVYCLQIDWDRLTLSPGKNNILLGSNNCTHKATCKGCASNYCWSDFTCQRFENDNLARYDR